MALQDEDVGAVLGKKGQTLTQIQQVRGVHGCAAHVGCRVCGWEVGGLCDWVWWGGVYVVCGMLGKKGQTLTQIHQVQRVWLVCWGWVCVLGCMCWPQCWERRGRR
jgi:hypothetical protein